MISKKKSSSSKRMKKSYFISRCCISLVLQLFYSLNDSRRPFKTRISLSWCKFSFTLSSSIISWNEAAERLEEARWISSQDSYSLRALWHFGSLIGNNDMHYGNISFFIQKGCPMMLAPSYDMLPMSLRPNIHGQLPMDVNCQLQPGCPSEIRELTQHFWKQVESAP